MAKNSNFDMRNKASDTMFGTSFRPNNPAEPKGVVKTIEEIAAKHLNVETLKEQRSDRLDFHSVAVWEIKSALIAAYNAGKQAK